MHNASEGITQWLDQARGGDRAALDRVLQALYHELHAMARRQLGGGNDDTLDPTALVHEAYLKLAGQEQAEFADRGAFFAYAASAMRSVVVDHARARVALKRGGGQTLQRVAELAESVDDGIRLDEDLLSLDRALGQLQELDPQLARVVELRYFAGLSEAQIAELIERSERSVRRDWQKARMFLLRMLQGG
ncbi:ECF-type sigma factor [Luteimonas sp. e5]